MANVLPTLDAWKQGTVDDVSEINDCYCSSCGSVKATTVLLPTKVPGFREIILATISCDDCGLRRSDVDFAGTIQGKGVRLTLNVRSSEDLNRQVLKGDAATLMVPKLQLEIPSSTQRGSLSTVEGMLRRAAENLSSLQSQRLKLGDLENFNRCQGVIDGIRRIVGENNFNGNEADEESRDCAGSDEDEDPIFPFELILDDSSGNSYIENPFAPRSDPNIQTSSYDRTPSQDMMLGLQPSQAAMDDGEIDDRNPLYKNAANQPSNDFESSLMKREVVAFPTTCPGCREPADTNMCTTNIPNFKEIIIMSLLCDNCGFRSNEVKGAGAIPERGSRITLKVEAEDDLEREVLKSDTAGIGIPEIELELEEGGMGGVYTSIEGLLKKIHDTLTMANPFGTGDSVTKQHRSNDGGEYSEPSPNASNYMRILSKIQGMSEGLNLPFTLIICDPLANSFIGPSPDDHRTQSHGSDSGLIVEYFERTDEQNGFLGINDMKTEGYQEHFYQSEEGGKV